MIRVRAAGPSRPQAAHGPDRARDRSRRRDGQRHVRAHRLDRRRVQLDLLDRSTRTPTPSITGQVGVRPDRRERDDRPVVRRVAAAEGEGAARRWAPRSAACSGDAQLIGKDGKAIVFGGAPNLGFSVDPDQPQFNSPHPRRRRLAEAGEVVIDKSTAGKKDFTVGQTIGVQARGPGREVPDLGPRQVRRGVVDRRRDARRVRPADGADAVRQGRQARPDPDRREGRASRRRSSSRECSTILPDGHAGANRRRAGAEGRGGHERLHLASCRSSCSPSAGSRSSSARS